MADRDPEPESLDLQILIVSGPEAPEKAVLGLAAALSAVHSAMAVRVVFAMRGAVWCAATEGNSVLVPGYPPIGELIANLVEEGVAVRGCSSCVDQYCPAERDDAGLIKLRAGIGYEGLSAVTLMMSSTNTVTF
ncbi:MAG: DsrE family protein [Myxococcota bacterium]